MENPPRGDAAGSENCSLRQGENSPDCTKTPSDKQVRIVALQRDFAVEAGRLTAIKLLRATSVKAGHAADNLALADDAGAEREISLAIANIREAAAAFRQMQASIDAQGEL